MILTPWEIIDIIIMTLFVGFIFRDQFRAPSRISYEDDPVGYHMKSSMGINWNDFWFAAAITAPAIILHEFGHKFLAMSFGYTATFHAAYFWLATGLVLKLLSFPFIFFVPAYVSYPAMATPIQSAIIAFAGPAVNLILWLGASFVLKKRLVRDKKIIAALVVTTKINMFLFIFNMIPIPPFDGYHVVEGIFRTFF